MIKRPADRVGKRHPRVAALNGLDDVWNGDDECHGVQDHSRNCRNENPFQTVFERLPQADKCADALLACQLRFYFAGFTNRNVMRSDSPIATYFARSTSLSANDGGSAHTPPL